MARIGHCYLQVCASLSNFPDFARIGYCVLFSWLHQEWEFINCSPTFASIEHYFLGYFVPCSPGFARIGYLFLVLLASPGLGISSLLSWLRQDWALIPCCPGFARIGRYFLVVLASPGLGVISLLSWLREDWALVPCIPGFARIGH
jgi:hypothetical protein